MNRCLHCYQPLGPDEQDVHPACSEVMFGTPVPPLLPYSEADLEPLATEVIQNHISVTGVQTKLSLHLSEATENGRKRLTIVGLWGNFILKPPTSFYPQLPEVEDLTMHLARLAGITTVPHCLIRMASGNLAYLTRRIDRTQAGKLAMEDLCQLTERLTEDKYLGSYEQVAKAIQKYSATPGLDVVSFFEVLLFSFLTGNADMHLKNFSLIEQPKLGMVFSPAYDLVNTALVNPADPEELALTLNGKKRKIRKPDFLTAMTGAKLDTRQQKNIFLKMEEAFPLWSSFIEDSLLDPSFKARYRSLLSERFAQIQ